MHTSSYGRQQSAGYSSVCVRAGEDNARLLTSGLSHLDAISMHQLAFDVSGYATLMFHILIHKNVFLQ